jgi:hypothetical protein
MVGKKTSEPQKAAAKAPEGAPTKAQKIEPQRKVEPESDEEEVVSGSESGSEVPAATRAKPAVQDSESSEEVYEDDDESFEDEDEEEEESDESYEEPPKAAGRKRGRAKNSDDD